MYISASAYNKMHAYNRIPTRGLSQGKYLPITSLPSGMVFYGWPHNVQHCGGEPGYICMQGHVGK